MPAQLIETREMVEDGCGVRIHISEEYGDRYFIRGKVRNAPRNWTILTGVEQSKDYKEGYPTEPFMTLSRETMESLFQQLWSLGFRPKDGTGNAGHIAAMQYHLEDMRKLVFKEKKQ